jgi:lipopolysaccharide/colanic/teichoic acid biosynthesis glycosyltransferase
VSVSAVALEPEIPTVIDLTDGALGRTLELVELDGLVALETLRQRGRAVAAHIGKRAFDIVGALVLLVVLLPALLIAAIAVKLGDRGPVLFRQERIGLDGRTFTMCKLRSMVIDAERLVIDLRDQSFADGLLFKIENDPRVTTVGRWIRRTCIDEVPQLWNVLRGDMSLVGPRPLPVRADEFTERDGARHVVKPGLTGPWQVLGGPRIPYREMIDLDLGYVQTWSFANDISLLARTIPAILGREHV